MQWFYGIDDQRLGPVTQSELGNLFHRGVIDEHTYVWRKGMSQWKRVGAILHFVPVPAAPESVTSSSVNVPDALFDQSNGWSFSPERVPIRRLLFDDGQPYYLVTIDGIEILVYGQLRGGAGALSTCSARQLVTQTFISNVSVTNPRALADGTFDTRGMPSFGIDADGRVSLQMAVPFSDDFPLEWLRKQVLANMEILAGQTRAFIESVPPNDGQCTETPPSANIDWKLVKNVASVAGILFGGFFDE
jgi:hypothetical protein